MKARIFKGHRFVCLAPGRWISGGDYALTLHGKDWKLWQRSVSKQSNFHFQDDNNLPQAMRLTSFVRLRTGATMKDAAQGLPKP